MSNTVLTLETYTVPTTEARSTVRAVREWGAVEIELIERTEESTTLAVTWRDPSTHTNTES